MPTKCALIKLKPGSSARIQEWATTLNARRHEVLETLQNEGVSLESVFLANLNGEDYLVYVMRSDDFERARHIGKNSLAAIDAYHKQFKADTWLERTELENLIDFACLSNLT